MPERRMGGRLDGRPSTDSANRDRSGPIMTEITSDMGTAGREGEPRLLRIERPAPHVMRIVLDRPDRRNAQDPRLLYQLNDAFDLAGQDDEVKVVILAGEGPT